MGFARAWLPSRRSVESQIGGDFATFEGHVRLGKLRGVYGLYFWEGSALGGMDQPQADEANKGINQVRINGTYSIGMVIGAVMEDECGGGVLRDKAAKRRDGSSKWNTDEVVIDSDADVWMCGCNGSGPGGCGWVRV